MAFLPCPGTGAALCFRQGLLAAFSIHPGPARAYSALKRSPQETPVKQMFIGGRWLGAQDGRTLPVINPANGETFDQIARGAAHEVDLAVKAARTALEGPWGRLTATERGRLLIKLGNLVLDHHAELAALEAQDTGKPMTTARNDITVLARYFEFYGSAADKLHGEVIPFLNGHHVVLMREPLGVTGHIIPWNYPAQMLGRTIAPALAAGNAVVLKPAEDTSLSALRVAELAAEVGFPDGSINVVTGLGEEAGAALAGHPGIDFISFTGSNEVGTLVQQAAAKNAVKCVLELGGKSPQIVFEDADIERAVPIIVRAIVQNAGQTCTAGSRLLVQQSVYDRVVEQVAAAYAKVRVGTPEMDLDCGPVMNPAQQARVNRYIAAAKAAGIPVLAEGSVASGVSPNGHWVTPTFFGPVPRDAQLACEEVFGPVLAAFQTRVAKSVKAGQLFINCYGAGGGVELPFGGTKRSGHGREKGFLALEEMSTTKTVIQYHG